MALTQRSMRALGARLRARGLQRRRQPRRGRRRRRRRPRPPARRAALGGRHELHAGARRRARAAAVAWRTAATASYATAFAALEACDDRRSIPASSRPTTSAASTRTSSTRSVAYRGRARVRARAGRPARAGPARARPLRVAVGHDMRLHSPALAERLRAAASSTRAADVLDIGMVGTEMVYYAVGSRELDGGVSVTASHNPKPPGPASSSCARARSPLSGDSGIQDVRRIVESEDFSQRRRRRARYERRDVYEEFHRHVLGFIDAGRDAADGGRARRRQRHGGPDGRADARPPSRVTGERLYFEPNGRVPRPRAEPAAGGEPQADHRHRAASESAELGIAWDGDADRCFFIDDDGRVRAGRLPDRAAGGVDAGASTRARRSSTTCAPAARCPTSSTRQGRPARS